MLNKNSLAMKKAQAQLEATMVISDLKRWPSDKANHSCKNAL